MNKNYFSLIFFFLIFQFSVSQIVINELDCDTPSTDTLEFIELKSNVANFSLNGFIVVLFNGSSSGADSSYFAIDLNGHTTDVNGIFLIGSSNVSPVPQLIISPDVIQNGADAVAIYQADISDFPGGTLATTTNLIDALVYDTSDADDTVLIGLLGESEQINENANGNKDNESIQRNNDGTYTVKTPTPRALNDGSGVVLNGVSISIPQSQYNEGDSFDITITAEQNVTQELDINLTLNNATFNIDDYIGNTSLTIPVGQNTVVETITLVDDVIDEGDEVLKINLGTLPEEYLKLNDNVEIRVVDNDFVVSPWGTPKEPTYGLVSSTQPNDYYNDLDGLADLGLQQAMQNIIANQSVVRAQTYADVIDILKEADQNPKNSNQVWLVYTEQGRAKLDFQTSSNSLGKWNREHTYPRSRGGFFSIDEDEIADGVDMYRITNADSLRHGNSDAHALRAADGPENSSRGNQHYGQYNGPAGNLGSFKGDVARSIFYMAIRYNDLSVVNGFPDTIGQLGDLTTLLDWHRNDQPDDFEMRRNNVVYTWQFNRNPFIDHPDLVEHIWGNKIGQIWNLPLNVNKINELDVLVYPNPAKEKIYIKGFSGEATFEVFSVEGRKISDSKVLDKSIIDINLPQGVYLLKISSEGKSAIKKIIIK